MNFEHIVRYISIASGIPAIVLALIAIRTSMRQSRERATSTPDVTLDWRLVPLTTGRVAADAKKYIIEIRARIDNAEHTAVCFPLAYARYRAPLNIQSPTTFTTPLTCRQFDELLPCGELSAPRNITRLPNSISQLAPGNSTTWARWDIIDGDFIKRYPVCIVCVTVFAVSWRTIGVAENGSFGRHRLAWLDYMNGKDRTDTSRHNKIIVTRATQAARGGIGAARRVLLLADSDEIDVESSVRFRKVLDTMQQTDAWLLCDLRGMAVNQ